MSLDLSALTPQEVTQLLTDLAAGGLTAFGQPELAALALAVGALATAVETAITNPSPAATLTAEVDTADAAADEAERVKLTGKP